MTNERSVGWSRREFLTKATLAGAAGFLGLAPSSFAAEPPLETTTIRLIHPWPPGSTARIPFLCMAPHFLAEELLRAEGFTDIRYVEKDAGPPAYNALASGEGDLSSGVALGLITQVDAGAPIVILAGVHVGCYELFGTGSVRSVRDLKGKTVSVPGLGSGAHLLLAEHGGLRGPRPQQGYQIRHSTLCRIDAPSCGRKN